MGVGLPARPYGPVTTLVPWLGGGPWAGAGTSGGGLSWTLGTSDPRPPGALAGEAVPACQAAPGTSLLQPITRTGAELSCPPHQSPGSSGQRCGRGVRPAHSGSRDSSPPHDAAGSGPDFSALPTPPAGTCAGRGGHPGCPLRAGSLATGSGRPSASWALPPPFLPPSRAFTSCCLMSQLRVTEYPEVSAPVGAPRRAGVSRLGRAGPPCARTVGGASMGSNTKFLLPGS